MRAVPVAVATLVLAATACGNGTKLETRTEALLHASIVGTTGSTRYVDHYDSTTGPNGVIDCSTAASDGNSVRRTFVITGPGTVRAPLYFSIGTREFSGPGVYRDGALVLGSIGSYKEQTPVDFFKAPASHVTLTLNDDGSGTASFTGYRSPQGTTLAARMTWTCTNKTVLWPKDAS
ncbi:MAG TPA: hypothetical protein VH914_06415 [Acidimicrobiia bacterium]|jgi:hypothetical protein|nr:hypothetical protein [Acidimicrobiia bacterium]